MSDINRIWTEAELKPFLVDLPEATARALARYLEECSRLRSELETVDVDGRSGAWLRAHLRAVMKLVGT